MTSAPVIVGTRPWWLPVAATPAQSSGVAQTWLDLTAVRVPTAAPKASR